MDCIVHGVTKSWKQLSNIFTFKTTVESRKKMRLYTVNRVSLVAQLVKNLPAMQETWVQSLGWEDPLEEGKATHSSILAWRTPWTV